MSQIRYSCSRDVRDLSIDVVTIVHLVWSDSLNRVVGRRPSRRAGLACGVVLVAVLATLSGVGWYVSGAVGSAQLPDVVRGSLIATAILVQLGSVLATASLLTFLLLNANDAISAMIVGTTRSPTVRLFASCLTTMVPCAIATLVALPSVGRLAWSMLAPNAAVVVASATTMTCLAVAAVACFGVRAARSIVGYRFPATVADAAAGVTGFLLAILGLGTAYGTLLGAPLVRPIRDGFGDLIGAHAVPVGLVWMGFVVTMVALVMVAGRGAAGLAMRADDSERPSALGMVLTSPKLGGLASRFASSGVLGAQIVQLARSPYSGSIVAATLTVLIIGVAVSWAGFPIGVAGHLVLGELGLLAGLSVFGVGRSLFVTTKLVGLPSRSGMTWLWISGLIFAACVLGPANLFGGVAGVDLAAAVGWSGLGWAIGSVAGLLVPTEGAASYVVGMLTAMLVGAIAAWLVGNTSLAALPLAGGLAISASLGAFIVRPAE